MGGKITTGVVAGLGALSAALAGFVAAGTGPRLPAQPAAPLVAPATTTPPPVSGLTVVTGQSVEDAAITDEDEANGGPYGPTEPAM